MLRTAIKAIVMGEDYPLYQGTVIYTDKPNLYVYLGSEGYMLSAIPLDRRDCRFPVPSMLTDLVVNLDRVQPYFQSFLLRPDELDTFTDWARSLHSRGVLDHVWDWIDQYWLSA